MTRIILTVGCVGKTYLDNTYTNVYDFDKHTLEYKYNKTGFEHLSNEEFKGLPNRKINEGWFERYMQDWCKLIDSDQYDVVTGWLQEDCLNYLLEHDYDVELILVDVSNYEATYRKRSQQRGNNETYWQHLRDYYTSTLCKYQERDDVKVTVFDKPYYLSEYLLLSGNALKLTNHFGHSYIDAVRNKVEAAFRTEHTALPQIYVPFYTQLALTALSANIDITKEMVHDTWSVAYTHNRTLIYHRSLLPFHALPLHVQQLDQLYVDKLNEVVHYFKGLTRLTKGDMQ